MIEKFNSFYGNRHTSKTPFTESFKDIFRRHMLRNVYGVTFFTPEARGINYDDRDNPALGGFQVTVRLQFPTYDPRWTIAVQQKAYDSIKDISRDDAPATLAAHNVIAGNLTSRAAFDKALEIYSKLRWDEGYSRQGYIYSERILEDALPLLIEGAQDAPQISIFSMPAYETLRQGTHRLEEIRTSVLNRLREQRSCPISPVVT